MVYLELGDAARANYSSIVTALKGEFMPVEARFKALKDFESRKQLPGESPHVFLFNLKKLLAHAMPEISGEAKEALLLHHFLEGLPSNMGQQLRIIPEIKTVDQALARARLLSASSDSVCVAPVVTQDSDKESHQLAGIESTLSQISERLTALEVNQISSKAQKSPSHNGLFHKLTIHPPWMINVQS